MAITQISFKRRHAIYVQKLRRNATEAEHEFCCYLASLGLDYRFQQGFYHPFVRIADFHIPALNLIVEIDGPCHDPEKDKRRDEWFTRERGIRIIRISNEEAMSGKFNLPVYDTRTIDPPDLRFVLS